MSDKSGDPLDALIDAVMEVVIEAYDDAFIDLEAVNTRVRAICVTVQIAEREACAKVCEAISDQHSWDRRSADLAQACRDAIRARGES